LEQRLRLGRRADQFHHVLAVDRPNGTDEPAGADLEPVGRRLCGGRHAAQHRATESAGDAGVVRLDRKTLSIQLLAWLIESAVMSCRASFVMYSPIPPVAPLAVQVRRLRTDKGTEAKAAAGRGQQSDGLVSGA